MKRTHLVKNSIITLYLLSLFIGSIHLFADAKNHTITGDTGYILEAARITNGHESAVKGKDYEDGDAVNEEAERWFLHHVAYITFNYRYSNIIEAGADFSLVLEDPTANSLNTIFQKVYVKANPTLWLSMTFGKQQLKWGTMDVFHPINKLEKTGDPTANRILLEGLAGCKFVFFPTHWLAITTLVLPDLELQYTRSALRFDFTFAEIDLGVGAVKYDFTHFDELDTEYDIDVEWEVNPAWTIQGYYPEVDGVTPDFLASRKHSAAGFVDFVRWFNNFGLTAEFQFKYSREMEYAMISEDAVKTADISKTGQSVNLPQYERFNGENIYVPTFRAAVGFTYEMQAKPGLTLHAEYFFNSEGYTWHEAGLFYKRYTYHKENYSSYPMFLPAHLGTFGNFRQHYAYIGVTGIELTKFMQVGFSVMANCETLAFRFHHEVTFDIRNLIYLSFKYDLYHQFLDDTIYPSDLNFMDYRHKISFSVSTSYSNAD